MPHDNILLKFDGIGMSAVQPAVLSPWRCLGPPAVLSPWRCLGPRCLRLESPSILSLTVMVKFEELAEAACITCERFPGVDRDQLDLNDLFQSGHIRAEIEALYAKNPKNKGDLVCSNVAQT